MTSKLEEAFAEAARLPEIEQDAFASWLLEELKSEERWAATFSTSPDLLDRLADEALVEDREGTTELLDADKLKPEAP